MKVLEFTVRTYMYTYSRSYQILTGIDDFFDSIFCHSIKYCEISPNHSEYLLFSSVILLASNVDENRGELTVLRRQKGTADKIRVVCPKVIDNYNKWMGGVDLVDQRTSYYQLDRKARFRFYLRVFFDMMDISVVNAFIIYNQRFPRQLTLLQFKEAISDGLTRNFSSRKRNFPQIRSNILIKRRPSNVSQAVHLPTFNNARRRCVQCSKQSIEQRTFVKCTSCDVSLCLLKERNCFLDFHS